MPPLGRSTAPPIARTVAGPVQRLVVLAAALAMALTAAACSNADRLAVLRGEPILAAPPGATDLGGAESDGSTFGFGSPARTEVVWGVDDLASTMTWYDTEFGATHDLRESTIDQLVGTRAVDGIGVRVGVSGFASVDDITDGTLLADQADLEAWPGPVVVVGLSSD